MMGRGIYSETDEMNMVVYLLSACKSCGKMMVNKFLATLFSMDFGKGTPRGTPRGTHSC